MYGADQRDIDQIAEYADSGVRQMIRTGSLAPIAGRGGVNKWLYDKWGNRGNALYTALGSLLTIGLSGLFAWALKEPLVFPSLGATAFLFFETPLAEVASVRNTVIGHTVGTLVALLLAERVRVRRRPVGDRHRLHGQARRLRRARRSASPAGSCACCAPHTRPPARPPSSCPSGC